MKFIYKFLLVLILMSGSISLFAQENPFGKNENWTQKELMQPAELAAKIEANEKLPVILSVGPSALIPHSIDIGMVADSPNLKKLDHILDSLPKDTGVVIYCGCCPFDRCPNIRPAISALKERKFTNFHLLNLNTSIKADWIDKDYPLTEEK